MAAQRVPFLTPEQYLEIERKAEFKSEYYSGEMFAMAGSSPMHNVIVMNIAGELRTQLKGKRCTAHAIDVRVQSGRGTGFSYPDVVVRCGEPKYRNTNPATLLNPTVIVEVLSPSTKAFDEGLKFRYYREIDSLMDYVLVEQDKMQVVHYVRQPNGDWLLHEVRGADASITLVSIDCRLQLSDIYDKVEFPPEEPEEFELLLMS
jgi:Uma2 family endonuclease